jgi:hypothetical protein
LYLRFGKWNIVNLFHMCLSDVFFFCGGAPQSTSLSYSIIVSLTQGNHVSQLTLSPWRCKRCSSLSSAACLLAYGKMSPSSRNWIPQLRFA